MAGQQKIVDQNEVTSMEKGPNFGKRHVQAIMLLFGIAIEQMTRSSLALSVVAMTENSTSSNPNIPTYQWSDTHVILSSFFWGYVFLQILAGQLVQLYGAKWFLFASLTINSLATILIPPAAALLGSKGVMGCRILQGLVQGSVFPTCHTMLGRWAPVNERGRMSTFVYSGMQVGSILSLAITGAISESYLGWPATFYLFGGCGLLWCGLWAALGQSSPSTHPSISSAERRYIEQSLDQETKVTVATPWKAMFTSVKFWAQVIANMGTSFGMNFLDNELPTYLEKGMGYKISSTGYLSAVTTGVAGLTSYIIGPLSDFLIGRSYLSRTTARKLFEIVACTGSAATLLAVAYLNRSQAHLAIAILALQAAFSAAFLFGHGVNPIDLSPRFSGIILAVGDSLCCFLSLFAPLTVQFMVDDETNVSQWRIVLIIASLFYLVPGFLFAALSSGDRQYWDEGDSKNNDDVHLENVK